MGLVERGVELFRRVDEMIQPVPELSVRGSECFPNARDWQILKWMGIVTLGTAVGGLGAGMYDPTPLRVAAGMTIGFFGGIALANRIIDGQR